MKPRGAVSRRETQQTRDVRPAAEFRHFGKESKQPPLSVQKKSTKQPVRERDMSSIESRRRPHKRSRAKSIWFLTIVSIVCVMILFLVVSMVSAKAVVTVIPKTQTIPFSGTFTACKDTPCIATSTAAAATAALSYEVIELPPEELDQNIPIADLTDDQIANQSATTASSSTAGKATGTVVMYNSFSSTSPQKLPVGTHLSNSKGLMYLTLVPVTIPPSKKTAQGSIPGSVAVPVIASSAGAAYNIAPTDLTGDFKVVAYAGGPKYTTIYGHLKPDGGITGGATTTEKMVTPTLLDETYTALETQLQTTLLAKVKTLIPAGYVMYDGTYSIDYTKIPPSATSTVTGQPADTGTLVVGVQATFYGAMIKQTDLAQIIAARAHIDLNSQFPNQSYAASGLDTAQFHLILSAQGKTSAQPFSAKNGSTLSFGISGSVKIIGTVPAAELTQKLAGLSIAQSKAVFGSYGGIASAHAIITPFWKHSFPDSSKITISIVN